MPDEQTIVSPRIVEAPFAIELRGRGLHGHLHLPTNRVALNAVVLVPGGMGTGAGFDSPEALFRADDIAALGCVVAHFDPTGRGQSGGEEDYWGERHQEDLRAVLDYVVRHPSVSGKHVGILSLSMGITIAAGALVGYERASEVDYLFDWEGPSNRFVTTLNDTHPFFQDYPTSDDAFWKTREARNFIGEVRCGYFRFQGEVDHVQGPYKGHAIELLNLATRGKAAWTKCNDNPLNATFDEHSPHKRRWISARADQKERILSYLREVQTRCTRS